MTDDDTEEELLLVKADEFEYRGEQGANAARMAMEAEAGPGCLDIDWELVEYAEDLSRAVEDLERSQRSRKLFSAAEDMMLTVSGDDGADDIPVTEVDIGIDVTEPVREINETITIEGRSNVESPPWYHEGDQHGPDGHVACPRCEYYPLESHLSCTPGEPMEFWLSCPWSRCGSSFRGQWESETYTGDEAMAMKTLYERAENFQ